MTGLYTVMAIGLMVIGWVIAYGLKEATKAKGYKAPAKKVDITQNLDKQKAEADAANRAFKASLDEIFDSIDKDGDGKLTRRELKNGLKSSDVVMEAIGCKRLKDGMEFFQQADTGTSPFASLCHVHAFPSPSFPTTSFTNTTLCRWRRPAD